MSVSRCPQCALINPASAMRCDCGYDFRWGNQAQAYLTPQQQKRRIEKYTSARYVKIYLLLLACGFALRALAMLVPNGSR